MRCLYEHLLGSTIGTHSRSQERSSTFLTV
eukprot:COSAG03_NODE_13684_length_492_cov_37.722646_2_plen_29_part_01